MHPKKKMNAKSVPRHWFCVLRSKQVLPPNKEIRVPSKHSILVHTVSGAPSAQFMPTNPSTQMENDAKDLEKQLLVTES
jgi:hypothetical protein